MNRVNVSDALVGAAIIVFLMMIFGLMNFNFLPYPFFLVLLGIYLQVRE